MVEQEAGEDVGLHGITAEGCHARKIWFCGFADRDVCSHCNYLGHSGVIVPEKESRAVYSVVINVFFLWLEWRIIVADVLFPLTHIKYKAGKDVRGSQRVIPYISRYLMSVSIRSLSDVLTISSGYDQINIGGYEKEPLTLKAFLITENTCVSVAGVYYASNCFFTLRTLISWFSKATASWSSLIPRNCLWAVNIRVIVLTA